ncbi:S-adenosylmethionine:tRNA ribosyltransferase-isomerase [Pollutibacter soli]|uniref:S-adenosylmethionine:tRNA ribosyltransferase-isomerase n=1 Tax=Pollutibacter soli TaxID=3034157 RepID=UPI003013A09F
MHPSDLAIKDFTYALPDDRIAKFPLEKRDESKLLVLQEEGFKETQYRYIAHFLPENALLVFNNTRVIAARILFKKAEGGIIEIFLLSPVSGKPGIADALSQHETAIWRCLIGGASKWKPGYIPTIHFSETGHSIHLKAEIVEREADSFIVRFSWAPNEMSFSEVIHFVGQTPLPPYLKRAPSTEDPERYQTIFAESEGSVAAPTAGLHFTPEIFKSLKENKIDSLFLTLHVGAGTFKPVKSETMAGHTMHAEWLEIDLDKLQLLKNNKRPVIAVGTTSLRTLESVYWMGVKCVIHPDISMESIEISQWEVYNDLPGEIDREQSLNALIEWMEKNDITRLIVKTGIFIAPGYQFRMINGLITNFHQPQSTLLLLVAALIGERWKELYEYAINHDFRFLSYGDGCLLFPKK